MSEVTRILSVIEQGDPHAAEQLLPLGDDALLSPQGVFACRFAIASERETTSPATDSPQLTTDTDAKSGGGPRDRPLTDACGPGGAPQKRPLSDARNQRT